MTTTDEPIRPEPDFEVIEGIAAFTEHALQMVRGAYLDVSILSQDLDRRVYGSEDFCAAVKKFALQHDRARLRVLVRAAQRAMARGHRLVEFGRTLTSRVEFRELQLDRPLSDEYVIADGRVLLHRADPSQLEAKFFSKVPHLARLQQQDFDALWNESPPSQELRQLRL